MEAGIADHVWTVRELLEAAWSAAFPLWPRPPSTAVAAKAPLTTRMIETVWLPHSEMTRRRAGGGERPLRKVLASPPS